MFFQIFFLFLIHFVTSNSNQEDLSISNYFHIGCLTFNPDKQFINNGSQENSLLPYQTFSSPNLTIDLCFRLCRRWIILMNNNHTNCICLYTQNELYEINEHLGEIIPNTNCTTNSLQIYSLTKNPYILPSRTSSDDWSFDGCYHLNDFQAKQPNISWTNEDYTPALTKCQDYCKTNRNLTDFSFFLSVKKSCYCLPISGNRSVSINMTGIRKPLIHCSFLPYVKNGFDNSFNATSVHVDTFAKINVHRYCSSSFVFNRNLYRCFKIISVNERNSFSKITTNEECSSMSVRTIDQYNHLLPLAPSTPLWAFLWINRNSTYLFDVSFKSKNHSSPSEDLCLVFSRTQIAASSVLTSCSTAQAGDYILCMQNPIGTINSKQSELKLIKPITVPNNITCPTDFILFDNVCYYVDMSIFVNDTRTGEEVCSNKSANSSLVKFDSHQLDYVDILKSLGRTFDDILLEFFYYQFEKKLIIGTKPNKQYLKLLGGNKKDKKACILRYFSRSAGGFNVSTSCDQGGHPVCQYQPFSMGNTIRSTSKKNKLILIIIVPLLSLITLIGIAFLIVCYLRRDHSSSPTSARRKRSMRRVKKLPIPIIPDEPSNAPTAFYNLVEMSPPLTPVEMDITDSIENLYAKVKKTNNVSENVKPENKEEEDEDEEEPYYATLKSPNGT